MSNPQACLEPILRPIVPWLYLDSSWWMAIGLAGTALFGSRFVIQWLYSERKGALLVPPIFWHLSFWGSILSLLYALHIDKLPVILGYVFLPFIFARNLYLLHRPAAATKPAPG